MVYTVHGRGQSNPLVEWSVVDKGGVHKASRGVEWSRVGKGGEEWSGEGWCTQIMCPWLVAKRWGYFFFTSILGQ